MPRCRFSSERRGARLPQCHFSSERRGARLTRCRFSSERRGARLTRCRFSSERRGPRLPRCRFSSERRGARLSGSVGEGPPQVGPSLSVGAPPTHMLGALTPNCSTILQSLSLVPTTVRLRVSVGLRPTGVPRQAAPHPPSGHRRRPALCSTTSIASARCSSSLQPRPSARLQTSSPPRCSSSTARRAVRTTTSIVSRASSSPGHPIETRLSAHAMIIVFGR